MKARGFDKVKEDTHEVRNVVVRYVNSDKFVGYKTGLQGWGQKAEVDFGILTAIKTRT